METLETHTEDKGQRCLPRTQGKVESIEDIEQNAIWVV